MKISEFYKKAIRKFIAKTFSFWQILGFHVTPVHFYQPIPDTRKLKDNLWQKKSQLVGIDMNEGKQLELLSSFVSKFRKEYDIFPKNKTNLPYQYYTNNKSFGSINGEILYCMVRNYKPKRIIEVGSGFSTRLTAQGILKNKKENNIDCDFITIDPYPNEVITRGFPGVSKLIEEDLQNIGLEEFKKLQENDIFFIDSSHVLKINSDVQYEYLEILPRLNEGVIVHFHDIFLPVEYPKKWVLKEHRFFNEQYLLQAFLMFNKDFEILWAGSYMYLKHPELLKKSFNSYNPDPETGCPGSLWIRRRKR